MTVFAAPPHPNPLPKWEREQGCACDIGVAPLRLTKSLPCFGQDFRHSKSPLPFGERVRVRETMRQSLTETAEARLLRQSLTAAEQALWTALRNRQFLGLKFRGQAPIGAKIVDFLCLERRLVVQVDSGLGPHDTAWFAAEGFRALHLPPDAILSNLPGCLQHLAEELSR
ncbi:endonuclease domain-containing protein [Cypionkella sinensis]